MDFGTVIFYIFAGVSLLYVMHFGFYLIGANAYDIWQLRRKRQLSREHRTYTPLVTVLIAARNEELVIERCLRSVQQSSYQYLQILVINDGSTDRTALIVRHFMKQNRDLNIRLISRRRNGGKGRALNYALQHYAEGELAMTLDADSIISKDTIDNAISYFNDPKVVGVAANVQIIDEFTVLGVLQRFEHMVGYRAKKTYSLTNCEFVIGGVASTYRMSTLRAVKYYSVDTVTEDIGLSMKIISQGNRTRKIVYAADVAARTEGVDSFRALLKQRFRWKYGSIQNLIKYRHIIGSHEYGFTAMFAFYRMPMAVISEFILLSAPLLWGYALYITINEQSLALFTGAYMTITAYLLIVLWFDENTSLKDRFLLTLYTPIAYFIFYIMDIVQLVAIARCLIDARKLVSQNEGDSVWQSPRRIGQDVSLGQS